MHVFHLESGVSGRTGRHEAFDLEAVPLGSALLGEAPSKALLAELASKGVIEVEVELVRGAVPVVEVQRHNSSVRVAVVDIDQSVALGVLSGVSVSGALTKDSHGGDQSHGEGLEHLKFVYNCKTLGRL